MKQIFISHVEEDPSKVVGLTKTLEAKGYTTWYYERDSVGGRSYLEQVGEAIDNAEAVMVLISMNALGSHQISREVVRAHETNKPFFPVLMGISHETFQRRQPEWRTAIGSATSTTWEESNLDKTFTRIIEGLQALRICPISTPGTRRKLFQLGYLYGQYGVTDNPGRAAILNQIEQYWGAISGRPPSEAVPENLRSMPFSHIVGELASFLRTSLGDRFPAQTDGDLCLLGFMLFCQPFARDAATAEIVIKYSTAAPLSVEERQELRKHCVAPDLGTRDGGVSFFNKWTGLIEARLAGS